MGRLTYAGGRNTVHSYTRTISRGTHESTFEFASTEPVIEFEWGYGVASTAFPGRYYTVKLVGDLWCGSCRDERIRPQHVQAVLDFIAAQKQAEPAMSEAEESVSQPATSTPVVRYYTKEEQQARAERSHLLWQAGYEFRLLGRHYWTPQYRKDKGEWMDVPGAERNTYESYAEKALDELRATLAEQLAKEQAA